jgi:hypothetical protein
VVSGGAVHCEKACPVRDELFEVVFMTFPVGGSEYGGRPGVIQPFPHDWKEVVAEQLGLAVRSDSEDAASGPEAQNTVEQKINRRRKV